MNFKSQPCTTEEQSKRLLNLGLKVETADMSYQVKIFDPFPQHLVDCIPSLLTHPPINDERFIPAWSFHRLIEMMPTYINVAGDVYTLNILQGKLIAYTNDEKNDFLFAQGATSLYDSIVVAIECLIQAGHFNKEYLCKL